MLYKILALLIFTPTPFLCFSQTLEKNGLKFSCAIYTTYYKKKGIDGSEYPVVKTGDFNCRCVGGNINYSGKNYTRDSFNGQLATAFESVTVDRVQVRGIFYNTIFGEPNKIDFCFGPDEEKGNNLRALKPGDIEGNVEVVSICAISGTNNIINKIRELEANAIIENPKIEPTSPAGNVIINKEINSKQKVEMNVNSSTTSNQSKNIDPNLTHYQNQIANQKLQQQQYNKDVEKLTEQSVILATEVASLIDNLILQAKEKRKQALEIHAQNLDNEKNRRNSLLSSYSKLAQKRDSLFKKYSINGEQTLKVKKPDSIFYFVFTYDEFYKDEEKMKLSLSGIISVTNQDSDKEKIKNILNPQIIDNKKFHFNGIYYRKEDATFVYEMFKKELEEYSIVADVSKNKFKSLDKISSNSKETDKATVYLIRKAGPGYTGNGYGFDVYFNDTHLATLSNTAYSELAISTGVYRVMAKTNANSITSFPYKIKLEKNKTYYIEIEGIYSTAGIEINIMELPEQIALKKLSRLKK
jgi:hypothetical protein